MNKQTIFVSYSHLNKGWKNLLKTQLGILEQEYDVEIWYDDLINYGDDWYRAIKCALDRSTAAIFLISGQFLTSNFILSKEVPSLLKNRTRKGLAIIPILIKPCDWQSVPWLSKMQLVNSEALNSVKNARTLQELSKVSMHLRERLRLIRKSSTQTSAILGNKELDIGINKKGETYKIKTYLGGFKSTPSQGRPIRGFQELLIRLTRMLEETKPSDIFRFLAYTPTLGYLARPGDEWKKLENLLRDQSKRIQFACLEDKALKRWHNRFKGRVTARGEITSALAKEASVIGEELLMVNSTDTHFPPGRLSWDLLPGNYMFANDHRAIVVVPLFVPSIKGSSFSWADQNVVEMLGFETTDDATRLNVQVAFDRYYHQGLRNKINIKNS